MEQGKLLAGRFREVMLDGSWIANTNYRIVLAGIDRQKATRKIGNWNTIYALVFHVNYYLAGVLQVLEGGPLDIRDAYSFDAPEIRTEDDWNQAVRTLLDNAEKMAKRIEAMPPEQWDLPFTDEKYGNYRRNIEGLIEHGYYHLGQLSLLRKAVMEA